MASIDKAWQWAVDTCNDPNVGYSQKYRNAQTVNGITYYDCSSFIWCALKNGGYTGIGSTPFTTRTMQSILKNIGFTEYSSTAETWQPGDIMWRTGHTEMVYEDMRTMGAHSSSRPLADQVSINDNNSSASAWTYIYRAPYVKTNPIADNTSGNDWEYKIGVNAQLTEAQMQNNADIIYNMCRKLGWTLNAVSALLGNCQAESSINPGQQETKAMTVGIDGTGLFQWTSTSSDSQNPLLTILDILYGGHSEWYDGDKQMNALFAEYQQTNYAQGHDSAKNWECERQWYNSDGSRYGFSLTKYDWYDWAHSEDDLETLTKSFMVSYERPSYDPATNHWERRVTYTNYWYEYLSGHEPPTPPTPPEPPTPTETKKWKWIYYMKRR